MNITINRKDATIQIEGGVSLGELVDELKELIGDDWEKYSISVIGEISNPWTPNPIYPLYPLYPLYPYYDGTSVEFKVTEP